MRGEEVVGLREVQPLQPTCTPDVTTQVWLQANSHTSHRRRQLSCYHSPRRLTWPTTFQTTHPGRTSAILMRETSKTPSSLTISTKPTLETESCRLGSLSRAGVALVAAGVAVAIALHARRRRRYSFTGRSVVITGVIWGRGLVLARQLAAAGAHLTLIARDGNELSRAVDDIHARYPSAAVQAIAADVTQRDDGERAIAETIAVYGRIDVLINNAGIIQVGPGGQHEVVRLRRCDEDPLLGSIVPDAGRIAAHA